MRIDKSQPSRRNPAQSRPALGHHFGKLLKTLSLMTTGGTIAIGLLIFVGIWKVDTRSMVVQQVRSASELTTAVFTMETVVPASRDRTVGGYVIGKTTLLYIAYGEVRAGVDLSELKPDDVQTQGDTTILRLPPPRILDSKIDVGRSKVYDYDRGFLGLGPDAAPELQELAQRQTLDKIVASACDNGILQAANDRAQMIVTRLLTAAGYTKLVVENQPSTACALPVETPIPVPPPPPMSTVRP
jgi:Protein of unknown function (DUF4230)